MPAFLLFVFIAAFPFVTTSQAKGTEDCDRHVPAAEQLFQAGQLDGALHEYEQAASCFYKQQQWVEWARAMKGVSGCKVRQGKYTDALASIDLILYRYEDVHCLLPPGDPFFGWIYVNQGYNMKRLGWFTEAKTAYEKAAAFFHENHIENLLVASYCYLELGNIYTRFGEYDKAIWFLEQFKRISEENNEGTTTANACSDLSIVYRETGRFERSEQICREGLALRGLTVLSRAQLISNLGETYVRLKQYSEAEKYVKEADLLYHQLLKTEPDKARILDYIGSVHDLWGIICVEEGRFKDAGLHYKQGLQYITQAYGTQHRQTAKAHASLGRYYTKTGIMNASQAELQTALDHFSSALGSLIRGYNSKSKTLFPTLSELYPENTFIEVFEGMGKTFEAHYAMSEDVKDLEHAFQAFSLAIGADEVLRNDLDFETSKLALAKENHHRIEAALNAAFILYENARLHRSAMAADYIEAAFRISETNRSVLLMEALRNAQAREKGNIPDSLVQQEKRLRKSIAQVKTLYYRQDDSPANDALRDSLVVLQSRQADMLGMIRALYPRYSVSDAFSLPSIREVQNTILTDKNAGMVEYFMGTESVYIIFITGNEAFFIRAKTNTHDTEILVENLMESISGYEKNPGDDNKLLYLRSAHELHKQFIAPCIAAAGKQKPASLIIIPDGVLGKIPFDALLRTMPNDLSEARYDELDYLLLGHTVSYSYSAKTLIGFYRREQTSAQSNFAFSGFAPEFTQPEWRLPSAIHEINRASELTGGHAFTGKLATLDRFLSVAEQSDIIHLATHAHINPKYPMASYIVFASADDINGYDTLSLAELYSMDLDTKLSVLSACNTGVGPIRTGEGLLSLASAFSHAGCHAEVMSQWVLPDESTENIMDGFYTFIMNDERIDVALQKAKLNYLSRQPNGPEFSHPFYWAGLNAIGYMQPLDVSGNTAMNAGWWWIAGCILILLLVYTQRSRFSKLYRR